MAIDAIRSGAIQLCKELPIWTDTLDPIYPAANVSQYEIDPPSGSVVVAAVAGEYDGGDILPTSLPELEAITGWRRMTGTPSHFVLPNPSVVRLYPMPTEKPLQPLIMEARLAPSMVSYEGPDFLYELANTVARWAKYELLDMTGRPWHNSNEAAKFRAEFFKDVDTLRGRVMRGHTTGQMRVKPRKFI
jgi:hypothetical protein